MIYDLFCSAVRTLVPAAIALGIGWGLIPESMSGTATGLLDFAIFSGYYLIVRSLEPRWPWLGWLLGKPTQPTYQKGR